MACEVPVISTPVGQCIDIIKMKNGFLCDGFSSDEIASKSLKILNKQIESKK